MVELGDFGSFWLRNSSEGSETADEVNETKINIIKPRFNPGKEFKKVLKMVSFTKA